MHDMTDMHIQSHIFGYRYLNVLLLQGCLRKKGKDVEGCRSGFGLIALISVVGLCMIALLAGAAFWFYVVRTVFRCQMHK